MKPTLYVEPFAGSFAVGLALLGGTRARPPIAYMGAKRRYAADILGAFGLHPGQGAAEVVLIDAGPWGRCWQALTTTTLRMQVVGQLLRWQGRNPVQLWDELAAAPPPPDPAEAVAGWLWLQARSANSCPVWHDPDLGWRMGDKPRAGFEGSLLPKAPYTTRRMDQGNTTLHAEKVATTRRRIAEQGHRPDDPTRGGQAARGLTQKATSNNGRGVRGGGMVHPATIAERIEGLAPLLKAARWTVLQADATAALGLDLRGAVVYADPPYENCTGYPAQCPRAQVLELCSALAAAGARVAVSEATPLPLPGWHALRLTDREWLTLAQPPVRRPVQQQALLFAAGAA